MEETPEPVERNGPAVTVSITRRVKPGRESEFEEWLRGIIKTLSGFPGCLGTQVFRPTRGN